MNINELAREYTDKVTEMSETERWVTEQHFINGYQKAREDLMSQASEEHKDWYFKKQNPMRDLEKYPINEIEQTDLYYLTSLKIWQAAKLSSLKEIRETKEACSLIVAQKLKEIEVLKSEIAELEAKLTDLGNDIVLAKIENQNLVSKVVELEKDNKTLLRALKTIAEKETCKELNPEQDKYNNYQEGWEGVALFAQKTIAVRKLIDEMRGEK